MDRSYDEYKEIVNAHLMDFMPNIDNKSISLYESMKYSLMAGGKRLRPVLLLASCEFAGGSMGSRRRQKRNGNAFCLCFGNDSYIFFDS